MELTRGPGDRNFSLARTGRSAFPAYSPSSTSPFGSGVGGSAWKSDYSNSRLQPRAMPPPNTSRTYGSPQLHRKFPSASLDSPFTHSGTSPLRGPSALQAEKQHSTTSTPQPERRHSRQPTKGPTRWHTTSEPQPGPGCSRRSSRQVGRAAPSLQRRHRQCPGVTPARPQEQSEVSPERPGPSDQSQRALGSGDDVKLQYYCSKGCQHQ